MSRLQRSFSRGSWPDTMRASLLTVRQVGQAIRCRCNAQFSTSTAFNRSMSTGSGKSFTMFGPNGGTIGGPLEGIIPRLASDLFAQLAAMKAKGCVATVAATYIEVYREDLRDLWDAGEGKPSVDTDGDGVADAVGAFSGAADEPRIRNLPNGTIQLDGATRQVIKRCGWSGDQSLAWTHTDVCMHCFAATRDSASCWMWGGSVVSRAPPR